MLEGSKQADQLTLETEIKPAVLEIYADTTLFSAVSLDIALQAFKTRIGGVDIALR